MNIDLPEIERLAEKHPSMRVTRLLHILRAREKAEQLRAPRDYAVEEEKPREWSFFRFMLGRK